MILLIFYATYVYNSVQKKISFIRENEISHATAFQFIFFPVNKRPIPFYIQQFRLA